ncbi:cation:proton antiporter [Lactobacillus sp. ESL0791]|uniref:cation:proton antiporter n=1 Tax=Lactobacillus sp. ESL0791 TaxID=2983234 RepID=UPI0023F88BE2|nr:cation:proton antiporter [Lactobacillus sp. ESL0791]MDF7639830.1 cation:proton antiporter [Lactobacillus sp. ESL0791]
MHFIEELILILLAALLLGQLAIRLNLPAVIGQLLSGIILGSAGLNLVHSSSLIANFSQFGVIFLMFLAGLESDLTLLKKYFKLSFTVALVGVILPIIFMEAACLLFGMKIIEAIFIGIVFSATSVSISVVVLQEKHQLHSRAGTTILGAAVVDDILAVIVLSLFTTFSHVNKSSNNLPITLLLEVGYFGVIYFAYKFIIPYIMKITARFSVNYARLTVSLIIVLSLAWLADFTGLSAVVGAFFAGLAIRQTEQKTEIHTAISTIGYTLFIPVFFANIGLAVTFSNVFQDLPFIICMIILAILSKFWAGKYVSKLFGFNKNEANIVGAGMISRGEVALIVAQIGSSYQLFPNSIYSSLILVIIITTVLSPLILNHYINRNARLKNHA